MDKTAFLLIYQADRLYKELNQTESAVAAYKEIIQLFPTNRWADVARERLVPDRTTTDQQVRRMKRRRTMRSTKWTGILLSVVLVTVVAGQAPSGAPTPQNGAPKGRMGGDAEAVNLIGQRSELTRTVQGLELYQAGVEARRKALQEQIALIREEAGKRSGEDMVTQELQKLGGDKERQLAQLQQSVTAGRASTAELTEAEKNLAKARIELARRREEWSKQAGGGQLGEFTRELSRLAIDSVGAKAQLQIVRQQLEDVQKRLGQVAPSLPRTDVEAVNLLGRQSELTRKAQSIELDLAGVEARRKALQEQIAKIREDAGKRLGEDAVTQELQRLVGISERNFTQLQQSAAAGRVSTAELAEAEKNLAQARIEPGLPTGGAEQAGGGRPVGTVPQGVESPGHRRGGK